MVKVGILLLPCYAETLTNARFGFSYIKDKELFIFTFYIQNMSWKKALNYTTLLMGNISNYINHTILWMGNNSTRENILVKYVWFGFSYIKDGELVVFTCYIQNMSWKRLSITQSCWWKIFQIISITQSC